MIKEDTIKNWIVDEGIFREKKLDDNADFHYIVEFPKDNIMDVVKPREKDFIIIACATQVSPQHLELMNLSTPKERSEFLSSLSRISAFMRRLSASISALSRAIGENSLVIISALSLNLSLAPDI